MAKKIAVYKIDKGVPIPDEPETLVGMFPLENLEVGDSFEFSEEYRNYVQARASKLKARKGCEYTVRKVTDETCRVWRTA